LPSPLPRTPARSPRGTRTLVLAALLCLGISLLSVSAGEAGDEKTEDQPEPAKLPAPRGIGFFDQGVNDKRLAGYRTPKGFKVEIVAEAPAVVNPVGMTFADDGTPWVLEWRPSPGDEKALARETLKYKDGSVRTFTFPRKKKKDVVKVLTSSKDNGVFDKARVVLEDEWPSGILLHDGWLYLCGRGTVRRCKQSKPDGPFDKTEVVARGFGGPGRRQVSGMSIGNDGRLYLSTGEGDNFVEGSDGSRATVLRTGAVFRCMPDGSKLHVFAIGFCNPYRDVCFDLAGNAFHADNEPGNGCRLLHVAEGADFGWRSGGRRDLPGRMPALAVRPGAASGLCVYNDTRLPEAYRGLFFQPDAFRGLVRAWKLDPKGASFAATQEFKFLSAPKDERFRPCQVVVGPDGAVYVVDWRTKSARKPWGDGTHGRIYRIRWSGTRDQPELPLRGLEGWGKIARLSGKELIETLSSEEAGARERARKELVKRGEKNRKALVKLLDDGEAQLVAKVAALGAIGSMFDADVQKAFEKALKGGDSELQRLAAEALGLCARKADRNAHNALLQALSSDDLPVRRAVALAMGRLAGPGAGDNLAATLSFDESKDVFLRDGILRGLEMLGKPGIDALIALADSGVQKDTDRVVEAFLALRGRPAFDALPRLLAHPHVTAAQRAELIRSAGNYLLDPPVSLDAVIAHVAKQPKETSAVKKALLEVLGPPGLRTGPKAGAWVASRVADRDAEVRLAAIAAAQRARLAGTGPALAKRLGEEDLSGAERLALIKALRVIRAKEAVAPLKALLAGRKASEAVRREVFLTLAAVDPASATAGAKAFLSGKDPALQREAVRVLGATAEGARLAGKLYLEKKLAPELLPVVTEGLRRHAAKDAEAAKLLKELTKRG
jgi:glucose/arabinose dehydrogenase